MHMDPLLPSLVAAIFGILLLALLLRRFNQPHVVAYLLAGVALGPYGLGIIEDQITLDRLGTIGVILLLFYVGSRIHVRILARHWRISILGTLLQIAASVAVVGIVGWLLDWPLARTLLIGFMISLSSTAVLLSFLKGRNELDTPLSQKTIGILLVQDLAIIPMLIIIGFVGGNGHASAGQLAGQMAGAALILALIGWLAFAREIHLPWLSRLLAHDHELQVFAALILCFGLATLTGLLSLSTALGAFVAGMVVASSRETGWVDKSMESLRVVFVAIFFVSIGMLVDLAYLWANLGLISLLVLAAMLTNTLVNALVLIVLGETPRDACDAAAMLAQIGEFGFVLVAVGWGSGVIGNEGYQLAIAVIALTLLLAPLWIALVRQLLKYAAGRLPLFSQGREERDPTA